MVVSECPGPSVVAIMSLCLLFVLLLLFPSAIKYPTKGSLSYSRDSKFLVISFKICTSLNYNEYKSTLPMSQLFILKKTSTIYSGRPNDLQSPHSMFHVNNNAK